VSTGLGLIRQHQQHVVEFGALAFVNGQRENGLVLRQPFARDGADAAGLVGKINQRKTRLPARPRRCRR
jgi:hypothetical protein